MFNLLYSLIIHASQIEQRTTRTLEGVYYLTILGAIKLLLRKTLSGASSSVAQKLPHLKEDSSKSNSN